jgi:LuxR family transcriptional regulator, regulator of acetate metabolism
MSAPAPPAELYAGPVGAELARRMLEVSRSARALIGAPRVDDAVEPAELPALIAAVAALGAGSGLELDEHRRTLDRVRRRYETRIEAIERIAAAAVALRAIDSPQALLERAPRALAEHSGLARVVLSRVSRGAMHVEAVHVDDAPGEAAEALALLRAAPVRLAPPLIEAEILRRRRGTIVTAAQTGDRAHGPLVTVMAWSSYVAAAVIVRGDAVALLHADRGGASEVDALDRDVLWEFADGLAQAYERAALTHALGEERAHSRLLLEWLSARAAELDDVSLDAAARAPVLLVGSEPADPGARAAPPAALEAVLSRRELEVLRLLVAGRSNREIGVELVLAAGTVKFHVGSILRKLGVRNRAAAVSHYLALSGALTP